MNNKSFVFDYLSHRPSRRRKEKHPYLFWSNLKRITYRMWRLGSDRRNSPSGKLVSSGARRMYLQNISVFSFLNFYLLFLTNWKVRVLCWHQWSTRKRVGHLTTKTRVTIHFSPVNLNWTTYMRCSRISPLKAPSSMLFNWRAVSKALDGYWKKKNRMTEEKILISCVTHQVFVIISLEYKE